MKIGIIGTAYNAVETIEQTISPWIHAREKKIGGAEFVISIVSLPFAEYKDMPGFVEDTTTSRMLETLIAYEKIDYLTTGPKFIKETEARNAAMEPLLMPDFVRNEDRTFTMSPPCDYVWQVDFADEYYTTKEIEKIVKFIGANPEVAWFKGSLKNYVFDEKTYLETPFNPARIHKVNLGEGITIKSFVQDNDICYQKGEEIIQQKDLPNLTIPKNIAFVKHLTWLNNENSRKKCEYQLKRWGESSYRWNYDKNCLEFDENYYRKFNLSIPTVLRD